MKELFDSAPGLTSSRVADDVHAIYVTDVESRASARRHRYPHLVGNSYTLSTSAPNIWSTHNVLHGVDHPVVAVGVLELIMRKAGVTASNEAVRQFTCMYLLGREDLPPLNPTPTAPSPAHAMTQMYESQLGLSQPSVGICSEVDALRELVRALSERVEALEEANV
eukprot:TRINITY_DN750_c0_g1_i3.p1 TRINITY_DN750_c0_g1~~TRINITY_DN750_c0_g1_i3.p1  ORF type:complete len:166 (+),score=3.01 TRINITY_DN750_c0_g1_i3:703-1200(+)